MCKFYIQARSTCSLFSPVSECASSTYSPDIEVLSGLCASVQYSVRSCRSDIIVGRVVCLQSRKKWVGTSSSSHFKKNEFKWKAIERMYRNRNGEINSPFRTTPSTYCDFMLVFQLGRNSTGIKYHLVGLVWFNVLFTGLKSRRKVCEFN